MVALVAELHARERGAPWVRKFGNLPIRENLVISPSPSAVPDIEKK